MLMKNNFVEETFILEILPGTEEAFEADYEKAVGVLKSGEGFLGASLKQSIEQENRYLCLIKWTSVEAHTVDFKSTLAFEELKKILLPHYQETPINHHFITKYEN